MGAEERRSAGAERSSRWRWVRLALALLTVAPALVCLTWLLGDVGYQRPVELVEHPGNGDWLTWLRWSGELACHWGAHAAIALIPALILWRRRAVVCGVLLSCQLIGCVPVLLAGWEPRLPAPAAGDTTITVAHGNLNKWNAPGPVRQAAVDAVLANDGDITVLVEAYRDHDAPRVDRVRWPYQEWHAAPARAHGDYLVLLSRFPILNHAILDEDTQPTIQATLDVHGRRLHVYAVHPPSPWVPRLLIGRDRHLDSIRAHLTALLARDPAPVLLVGDFNLGVASPRWRELLQAIGCHRPGGREPATWPSQLSGLGIAIDHVLGRDLAMTPSTTFPIANSDHLGLATRISLR